MYARIFQTIYDGTLVEDWRALVTFEQMLILCDADGIIDMTARAIARRTGIPIEHIEAGIRVLESPDPSSRTPDAEGRRIARIDPHREWGWQIVNHQKYKEIRSSDDKREYMRQYMKDRRNHEKLTEVNSELTEANSKPKLAQLAHIDIDVDKDTDKEKNARIEPPPGLDLQAWEQWVSYRKQLRKPLKQVSIPAAQKALAAFGSEQRATVERSIANGWTGLFVRDQKKSQPAPAVKEFPRD